MKKNKFKKAKVAKPKKKAKGNKLQEYNTANYFQDYVLIGQFCNLPKSKKEWIQDTREDLKSKANKYEILLGEYLIEHKVKFIHQAPFIIDGKMYFLDFYVPNKRIAIEVDGQYHQSITQESYDAVRDESFQSIGIKTIRISNNETMSKQQLDIILSPINH